MDRAGHLYSIKRQLEQVWPARILIVGARAEPSPAEQELLTFLEGLAPKATWQQALPARARATVTYQSLETLENPPDARFQPYDMAVIPAALEQLHPGTGEHLLTQARLQARFVLAVLQAQLTAEFPSPGSSPETDTAVSPCWKPARWRALNPLAIHAQGEALTLLLGGGHWLAEEKTDPTQAGRVWYLTPNHQIYGGVKILYNHVDILHELGLPAVLATEESLNWPATWFAWNPRRMLFAGEAVRRAGPADVIVIPECSYRDVALFKHVSRRLLFVQNPGLCKDISKWGRMGYEGVLTLNLPDGETSQMLAFLQKHCKLPVFAISNHYSDDIWGQTTATRVPGRVLCLPRKGRAFVERLQREFPTVHCVEDKNQLEMAIEYAQADVYVHTGFPEGQPMPPIEAMLSGCVVCGFTGAGGLDVMRHGQTAFVAKDGNYDQLAETVRQALTHPHREAIRQAGRELVQQFHRSVTRLELEMCYRYWLPGLASRVNSQPLQLLQSQT